MNRYVITHEQIKGQEYIISALYDEKKKMIEVTPEPIAQSSILGNIYIGRVENIVENLNAAFIKISPEQKCYLSLEDLKHPFFTKKQSKQKKIVAGDELLVQVTREALKTKEPAVTSNLSFTGKYAVLTTGNQKLGVSSKLSKDKRTAFQQLLKKLTAGEKRDYGLIIRTNALDATEEMISAELEELVRRYHRLIQEAMHRTCFCCLYKEPGAYLKHLMDIRQDSLEEIVTDDILIYKEICGQYHISEDMLTTKGSVPRFVNQIRSSDNILLRYYEDDLLSLSSLYSVNSNLDNALKERVWLKSGAYLIIEHTEALTVIDVNTGKNVAKKGVQENFLKVNLEAGEEIARQLRLRNISGMILVDFMNLTSKDAEDELLRVFRSALRKDPIPTQLIDMTKLGLVEVTRKKVKKSLKESLPISN